MVRPPYRKTDCVGPQDRRDKLQEAKLAEEERQGTLVDLGKLDQRPAQKMQDSDFAEESESDIFEAMDLDGCQRVVRETPQLWEFVMGQPHPGFLPASSQDQQLEIAPVACPPGSEAGTADSASAFLHIIDPPIHRYVAPEVLQPDETYDASAE